MADCKTCNFENICEMPDFVRNNLKYCRVYEPKKKRTNADRLRTMSGEELAEFLEQIVSGNRNVIGINCGNSKCESWKCTECISMWLQSEVEEPHD